MNNAVAAVGKYGFVDKNDSIVVPIIFDYADHTAFLFGLTKMRCFFADLTHLAYLCSQINNPKTK